MRISIGKHILPCEVMDTDIKRAMGMMYRDELDGAMLFVFPSVKEQKFWMANCIIPLDMIFCVNDKITQIHKNVPPCYKNRCQSYEGLANKVIELEGGTCDRLGITKKDKVQLNPFMNEFSL